MLEEVARDTRDDGADVILAVIEIGHQWTVQVAKNLESIDVLFSAHITRILTIQS
ncbi:hypothetical protein [Haloterrigena salinisoli]|uniref:hypothetical protein n=1 Tax=Haloterrigena salinisoli TaxID=3132747 RepID=UPI0030CF1352